MSDRNITTRIEWDKRMIGIKFSDDRTMKQVVDVISRFLAKICSSSSSSISVIEIGNQKTPQRTGSLR